MRIAFPITVDQYSVLSITGVYMLANGQQYNSLSFLAQIGNNITTFNSLYYQRNQFIVPLFNIVIKLDQGVLTDIVWVNDCYTCPNSNNCRSANNITSLFSNNTNATFSDNNCFTSIQSCVTSNSSQAFGCDPKFYVTWFGSDANNNQLQSSNLSLEKFRQYSIGSLYSAAVNVFNNTINDIVTTYQSVSTSVTNFTHNLSLSTFKNNSL